MHLSIYPVAYRFHSYKPSGQCNPDGSPCQGIVYRSLDLRSYADHHWLKAQRFVPGSAELPSRRGAIPINFFEPQRLKLPNYQSSIPSNLKIEKHQVMVAGKR